MTTLEAVGARAAEDGLAVLGAFRPAEGDEAPEGCGALVLLGPAGAGFWDRFRAAPEVGDGLPDPLDRWSERVIGGIAGGFGAAALFPFGAPPWRPFTRWALRSGRACISPVGLLVHDSAGLFVSYRGALAMPAPLAGSPAGARPCDGCAAPCRSACPVAALVPGGYDLATCHGFLDTPAGAECMGRGCAVRRACPVGAGLRAEAQSAFHMRAFHGRHGACDA